MTCSGSVKQIRIQPNQCTTQIPSEAPTYSVSPTAAPTVVPSESPSAAPSQAPSIAPTESPSVAPTTPPTSSPTVAPSGSPTVAPSAAPTAAPTVLPTLAPSALPTVGPTLAPTISPSRVPTPVPTTAAPTTRAPSCTPTVVPTTAPVPITNNLFNANPVPANNQIAISSTTVPNGWVWNSLPSGGRIFNGYTGTDNAAPYGSYPSISSYVVWAQQTSPATNTLSQTVTFSQTGNYLVSLYAAPRRTYYNAAQSVSVLIGGTTVVSGIQFTTAGTTTPFQYFSGTYSCTTTGTKTLTIQWTQTSSTDSAIMLTGIQIQGE